jgi:hypothetical protein
MSQQGKFQLVFTIIAPRIRLPRETVFSKHTRSGWQDRTIVREKKLSSNTTFPRHRS